MMDKLIPFNYQDRQIRVVEKDGEPWFVAKDVCEVLEIEKHRDAISRLSDSQRGSVLVDTLGGMQEMAAVSEAGLYKLVFTSRKPEAEKFTDWVASEVIPSIRKTGMYLSPVVDSKMLYQIAQALEEKEKQILLLKPKAEFFDTVADSKTAIEMSQAAKVLSFGKGRNTLFLILRQEGILRDNNEPYQEYIDRGYFRVVEQKYTTPDGTIHISIKTLVYQRGLEYIKKVLDKRKSA